MNLRPYQQDAVEAAIAWMKKSIEPALLELATGAGKSWIAAAIANWISTNTGKKVLVLQPSRELTEQNHEKYLATGEKASIFSASAGAKCTRHNVVYGTPKTVLNSISRFGDAFGCVIVDEAHMITPTIKEIISKIRQRNNKLRVIGMTATPYRMNTGYIYLRNEQTHKINSEDNAINPYFASLLYAIKTRELIDMGFLTDAHTDATSANYDADKLTLNKMGQFDSSQVSAVFENQDRLTASIVQDVIDKSYDRKGVMLFASTVRHAQEIMQSLPSHNAMMLGGDINMDKRTREKLISDFKAQKFKYIVSVGTLTTGFDAPHVDTIAVLRATESASLFQQIIGRGLRLYDNKADCLVLDYAGNVKRHELEIDLFEPNISATKTKTTEKIEVGCPYCHYINEFAARPNPDELGVSKDSYFLDLAGNKLLIGYSENDTPIYMPAHFGRRCNGFSIVKAIGTIERCEYRWAFKECENCGHENDIAARYCEKKECKHELVDPNEKLSIEHAQAKRNPYDFSTEKVLFFVAKRKKSKAGNDMIQCDYTTPITNFRAFYLCNFDNRLIKSKWIELNNALFGYVEPCVSIDEFMQKLTNQKPDTVTYKKNKTTGYIDVYSHNNPIASYADIRG